MRKPGALTSLRFRATRLRSRLGLASLWAATRLETLADTVAVGLLRAEGLTWGANTIGILRPVVPPRRPRASAFAVDVVLLELREHGASVSIAEAEQIARRIVCASTYEPTRSDR